MARAAAADPAVEAPVDAPPPRAVETAARAVTVPVVGRAATVGAVVAGRAVVGVGTEAAVCDRPAGRGLAVRSTGTVRPLDAGSWAGVTAARPLITAE